MVFEIYRRYDRRFAFFVVTQYTHLAPTSRAHRRTSLGGLQIEIPHGLFGFQQFRVIVDVTNDLAYLMDTIGEVLQIKPLSEINIESTH